MSPKQRTMLPFFLPSFLAPKRISNVRIHKLASIGILAVLGGCSAPAATPARMAKVDAPIAPNLMPEEATTDNAAAAACVVSSPSDVATSAFGYSFAVGFGEKGGFLAWATPSGIRGLSLNDAGLSRASEVDLNLPAGAKPIEIAPLGRGFVIVAQRVETKNSLCDGRCTDATCSGWPAGTAQPHVCTYTCPKPCVVPVSHEFYLRYIDLLGKTIGGQKSWSTGLVNVEAILDGDGRTMGILTGNETIWIQTDDVLGLAMKREPLPKMAFALPVRGRRKPSLLAVGEDGSLRMIDATGEHALQGTIGDARSGRIIDARLQARWDANDHLHIAKQAWMTSLDSIQYSEVERDVVITHEQTERGMIRAPFAEYVESHFEDGQFRRRSWLQRSIGEDIDIRTKDPLADVRQARVVWTGKTFLWVYPAATTPQTLRRIVVDCGDRASKPS